MSQNTVTAGFDYNAKPHNRIVGYATESAIYQQHVVCTTSRVIVKSAPQKPPANSDVYINMVTESKKLCGEKPSLLNDYIALPFRQKVLQEELSI